MELSSSFFRRRAKGRKVVMGHGIAAVVLGHKIYDADQDRNARTSACESLGVLLHRLCNSLYCQIAFQSLSKCS